ncbi:alpha/beta hydrolase [Paramagnetospirillum kuznetsovii]|uniref:Alpha/beta hydrolase n=1 Tax=Paramagnetospirillum kuznetsovii TaxID=2053833 RepID=A0A364NTX0_9PROT|nr:alpha/beta hydrolase [Paramagnetospirillum kuznetsovii]RAU20549.1 alpha/beta hydrolase [Paramagnetospirillum kuznetsovii]
MSEYVIDGHRVFVAHGGVAPDPARPAVVLVHGAGMDHSVWALQSRALAHGGYSVLAVDLPGHGRSEGQALTSIAALAEWLDRFIATAGFTSAVVAGHSMGALAALELAARHPGRVRSLVLVGAAASMPVHADLIAAAAEELPAAVAMITAWGFSADAALGGNPAPGLWLTGGGSRLLERSRPGVLHADLAACNAYGGGEAAAALVRCPAVVVAGGADRMSPAKAGRALAGLIPGGRVQVLDGAGHMLMAERPEAVLRALKDYSAGIG